MKTIVVGDLHGQVEIAEEVLELGVPTIFIGDYLDSFTRSYDDQIKTLSTVLKAAESMPDVEALWGNHEMSYMDPRMQASGHSGYVQTHVNHMSDAMRRELSYWVMAEGFLLSHAGVSKTLLDHEDVSLNDYLYEERFDQIGTYRGGKSPCGGLLWCDWNQEFVPVEGVSQIVGHTRGMGIREMEGNYCVDCLDDGPPKFLVIDDGSVRVIGFNKEDIDWLKN